VSLGVYKLCGNLLIAAACVVAVLIYFDGKQTIYPSVTVLELHKFHLNLNESIWSKLLKKRDTISFLPSVSLQ